MRLLASLTLAACLSDAGIDDPATGVTIEPLLWAEAKKLVASDAESADWFGRSVSISGEVVIVGAPHEDGAGPGAGAAYMFARDQGGTSSWGEVGRLTAADAAANDHFGFSVAIDGDTAIVGAVDRDDGGDASGAAYLFSRHAGGPDNWGQIKKLTANGGLDGDQLGFSVAVSGDIAVVGATGWDGLADNTGAAYVFARNEGGTDNWGQVKRLTDSIANQPAWLGFSVAISGDVVIAGAPFDNTAGIGAGAVLVFARHLGGTDNWGRFAKLTDVNAEGGEGLGVAVALSGKVAVGGAPFRETIGGGKNAGVAYLFMYDASSLSWKGRILSGADSQPHDFFGWWVGVSGDAAIVGAYGEGASNAGAAYIFERHQGGTDNWGEVTTLTAGDPQADDWFGHSVAISGETAVIGAHLADGAGSDAGSAYVFALRGANGDPCGEPHECASGHCVGGLCCDTACDDAVFCNGVESCAGGVCGGSSGDPCADNLSDDDDNCAESCDESSASCTAADPDGTSCNQGLGLCTAGDCLGSPGSACEEPSACQSGHCVDEVCCIEPSCAPYRCADGGLCGENCASTADCAAGFECDAGGHCVAETADASDDGCSCRITSTRGDASRRAWLALLALGLAWLRRQRRDPTAAR